MACPSCGMKFQSDFKLRVANKSEKKGILTIIFVTSGNHCIYPCRGKIEILKKYEVQND